MSEDEPAARPLAGPPTARSAGPGPLIDPPLIDAPLVRRLIASQFPQWARLEIAPVEFDGWDHRTFHLGPEMSVRLPSATGYSQQVDKEQRWLPFLAPQLPLPIPMPLARGVPDEGYPFSWSVYRWLPGEPASTGRIDDLTAFATSLADFLRALYRLDARDGPAAGSHNFFRGGPLATYDEQARCAIEALADEIDADLATAAWHTALESAWQHAPVWVHGDVAAGNLLVRSVRLAAVIDFGSSGVGDPACDLTVAWTLLRGEGREAFKSAIMLDAGTWARARGWALWKASITLVEELKTGRARAVVSRAILDDVLAEFGRGS